jgi:hypothetical protein
MLGLLLPLQRQRGGGGELTPDSSHPFSHLKRFCFLLLYRKIYGSRVEGQWSMNLSILR